MCFTCPQLNYGDITKLRVKLSDPAVLSLLWEELGRSSFTSGVTDPSSRSSSAKFPMVMGQKVTSGTCFARTMDLRDVTAPNHRQSCLNRGRGKEDALTYLAHCSVYLKQKQSVLWTALWSVRGHYHCCIQTDTQGEES